MPGHYLGGSVPPPFSVCPEWFSDSTDQSQDWNTSGAPWWCGGDSELTHLLTFLDGGLGGGGTVRHGGQGGRHLLKTHTGACA